MVAEVREVLRQELAKESLLMAGRLRLRVTGTSMLPTIRPGAEVSVERVLPECIAEGDVVLTDTAAGLRLHRVVGIRPGPVFVTRGDHHRNDDPLVPGECLLGKVAAVRSAPGFLRSFWERLTA